MDDEAAAKIATDHLFNCGHRRMAGIFLMDDIQGHKRYSGFIGSCLSHGVKDSEKNVLWDSSAEKENLFINSAERIITLLGKVSAVVCYNDLIAVRLLKFCRENGISVPDDISVTGIDDSNYARICDVPLTTVRHPHGKLGETAAKQLLELMDTNTLEHEDTIFTPELVVRDSVKIISADEAAGTIKLA